MIRRLEQCTKQLRKTEVAVLNVEVFTRDGCKSSRRVKEFLAHHGIGFVERNLSTEPDARAEHAQIGYRGVPVIRAGERIISGFREQALGKLLGIS
jgi:glutaredoxin